MRLRLPPKSEWYVHEYRDRVTKEVHSVTTRRRSRPAKGARAICGRRVRGMWPRPTRNHGLARCETCLAGIAALDDLLEDMGL